VSRFECLSHPGTFDCDRWNQCTIDRLEAEVERLKREAEGLRQTRDHHHKGHKIMCQRFEESQAEVATYKAQREHFCDEFEKARVEVERLRGGNEAWKAAAAKRKDRIDRALEIRRSFSCDCRTGMACDCEPAAMEAALTGEGETDG